MLEYDDPYDHSGQFIDPMITGWWEHHGTTVADALRELPAAAGPVIDAGAGGGLGTRLIARTLPQAHVLAIEPSPPLRSVLLSRVFEDPDLRLRVTVDGDDLLSARLPNRLGGVVAANLIGHFSPRERDRLWEDLAARLAPGAFVLLNLPAPVEPERVERTRMAELRIGERHYIGWAEAEPVGTERITWRMTYQIHEGDRLVSRDEIHYAWWTLSEQALRTEATPHGLLVIPHGPAEAGLFKILREGNQPRSPPVIERETAVRRLTPDPDPGSRTRAGGPTHPPGGEGGNRGDRPGVRLGTPPGGTTPVPPGPGIRDGGRGGVARSPATNRCPNPGRTPGRSAGCRWSAARRSRPGTGGRA